MWKLSSKPKLPPKPALPKKPAVTDAKPPFSSAPKTKPTEVKAQTMGEVDILQYIQENESTSSEEPSLFWNTDYARLFFRKNFHQPSASGWTEQALAQHPRLTACLLVHYGKESRFVSSKSMNGLCVFWPQSSWDLIKDALCLFFSGSFKSKARILLKVKVLSRFFVFVFFLYYSCSSNCWNMFMQHNWGQIDYLRGRGDKGSGPSKVSE